ncbi:hypothetical protein [Rhodothermus marinus]|nr:hypothetical protein [Rhodothermus marinus]
MVTTGADPKATRLAYEALQREAARASYGTLVSVQVSQRPK